MLHGVYILSYLIAGHMCFMLTIIRLHRLDKLKWKMALCLDELVVCKTLFVSSNNLLL